MNDGSRFDALDAFRGITVAAMILVSTPGNWDAVYWPLEHVAWNGWTGADLVFPFFLFAMGAAVPLALSRRRAGTAVLGSRIFRRAAILFGLGLLLNAANAAVPIDWMTFRIPGVLQRIAVVYVVIAWLTEKTTTRVQIAMAIALLLGYWAAMTLVPVPGVGPGVLTPGGSLASFVDRAILGRHLVFRVWDPEGVLSTIPAVVTAQLGVFAGDWLVRPGAGNGKTTSLCLAGIAAVVVALIWNRVFPINKNLWTSSFVMLTGGLAAILLAACHELLDVRGWRAWAAPFIALGRNALAMYVLSVAVDAALTRWAPAGISLKWTVYWNLFATRLEPCCGEQLASAAYAVMYVVLWAIIATVMLRRRVFVRI